jgi:hypothetical protein
VGAACSRDALAVTCREIAGCAANPLPGHTRRRAPPSPIHTQNGVSVPDLDGWAFDDALKNGSV